MGLSRFQHLIASPDELASLIGTPSELVIKKQLSALDEHMRTFIAESPLLLLGTVDRHGRCDVSPRGDLPCVAKVLDARTLLLAERPGNRLADSLRNILETGRVGMLFTIPGQGETLRVNGRACVFRDSELLATMSVNGKQPVVGIGIEVEECYLQCAKALIRSKLWDSSGDRAKPTWPCFAQMLIDQTQADETVESLQRRIDESYAERLY
ncbi:MAG: pyridoxamine 5'-phosphate oxidase family protein [Planctomycetia bacterium]|nr:pyridoxamine 5'-phosphate oxidase family protein [Planctomycetia bacterium]